MVNGPTGNAPRLIHRRYANFIYRYYDKPNLNSNSSTHHQLSGRHCLGKVVLVASYFMIPCVNTSERNAYYIELSGLWIT